MDLESNIGTQIVHAPGMDYHEKYSNDRLLKNVRLISFNNAISYMDTQVWIRCLIS